MGSNSSKIEKSSKIVRHLDDGDEQYEKEKKENFEAAGRSPPRPRTVPKAIYGEQVAAGWPAWLSSVAGEAIQGWLPRRADTFEKLDKIGQGTYSNVYKARDLVHGKVVALKKVRFDNLEPDSVRFMAREIIISRRLDHPNIIKLEGVITTRMSTSLYLVFEYMEHDLTGIASLPGVKFTEPQIKCYMHQLLSGLEYCHSQGVLHRDIKTSNLLIDNQGTLKIADFGLSTFFDSRQKLPFTSRVVTLWYRPPELLLGENHYGVAVDLWSTGCVLGELYTGSPVMPGKTEFFTTKPFACDASSLPKYPPSKEMNVKLYKRSDSQPVLVDKGQRGEYDTKGTKTSQAFPPPPADGGLAGLVQRHQHGKEMDYSAPSGNVAQILEEHDRQIQNAIRQARLEKCSLSKDQVQESRVTDNPFHSGPSHVQPNDGAQVLGEFHHHMQETEPEVRPEIRRGRKQAREKASKVYSGPAIVPTYSVDQLLEEHDRLIQESAQKLRLEKRRGAKNKTLARERQITISSINTGSSNYSVNKVDQLLEEHDHQIQEATQRLRLEKKRTGKLHALGKQIRA